MSRLAAACAALLLPLLAWALPEELDAAFSGMPEVDTAHWVFTEIVDDGERIVEQRHDPREAGVWRLLSVDGRAPNAEELDEFSERIEKRLQRDGDEPGDNDFRKLADDDSWQLVAAGDGLAHYTFQPRAGDDDLGRFARHLTGELTLDRTSGTVRSFAIRSRKPFRVRLVASIQLIETVITMQAIGHDAYFPDTIETTVRGKAFGLKRIDEAVTIRYRDFEYVGPAATAQAR